ncbi:MAG: SHOCT domain-containing protein [Candidatus Pacebacteria bacterium]|nr:SHOCT domain-containing protein [Candidatus Paceibacterota bacterium]
MWSNSYFGYPMMEYGGYGSFWLVNIAFTIISVVIVVAVVVAAVRFARGGKGEGYLRHGLGGNIALDILKERYAKGEIDKKEFEEKKEAIS